jgi:hypothetical protein
MAVVGPGLPGGAVLGPPGIRRNDPMNYWSDVPGVLRGFNLLIAVAPNQADARRRFLARVSVILNRWQVPHNNGRRRRRFIDEIVIAMMTALGVAGLGAGRGYHVHIAGHQSLTQRIDAAFGLGYSAQMIAALQAF